MTDFPTCLGLPWMARFFRSPDLPNVFSALQLCVHGDFGVEQAGDGAAFLRVLCSRIKFVFIRAWNFRFHLKMDCGDRESSICLFQSYAGRSIKCLCRHSGIAKLGRERHGKASGMGRCNQFFRVCSRLRFKAGVKRIRSIFKNTAWSCKGTFAVLQSTCPVRASIALHSVFASANTLPDRKQPHPFTGVRPVVPKFRLFFVRQLRNGHLHLKKTPPPSFESAIFVTTLQAGGGHGSRQWL